MRVFALAAVLLGIALTPPASAQSYQCRMPQITSVPQVRPDGPVRRLPVTGYVLALSWSPEFCKPRKDQRSHALQCSGRNGRFGFVVHGLWPQSGNSWPQWCQATSPTARQVSRSLCRSPSTRLVARQWAKHGSCMTRRPETYFEVTRILYDSLRLPDFDRLSRKEGLTAGDIREWFLLGNRGWRADAIGVKLNERGWLEELRLCYDRRFRPAACNRRTFGARDGAEAKIWRGL